eukprot:13898162-Heterocapsa_arctica.AAC.1
MSLLLPHLMNNWKLDAVGLSKCVYQMWACTGQWAESTPPSPPMPTTWAKQHSQKLHMNSGQFRTTLMTSLT